MALAKNQTLKRLAPSLAAEYDLPVVKMEAILESIGTNIADALIRPDSEGFLITGVGKLAVVEGKVKRRWDLQTKTVVETPARKRVVFKASRFLMENINFANQTFHK